MAVFITSRPFRGVQQMKYERMLETCPETVRTMEKDDLEGYLRDLESRYRDRTMQLLPSCMQREGATEELKASDWMAYYRATESAQRAAREIALAEMMEA